MIRAADLLPTAQYRELRREFFRRGMEDTRKRRVFLGPHAALTFQNRDLVLTQLQETMLAEPGAKVEEEIEAYGSLVPDGASLVFTLMFEIENPTARDAVLRQLGGVEHTIQLQLGEKKSVTAVPLEERAEVERTTKEGKTSAVHFLRFPLTRREADAVRGPVVVACSHPRYGHMASVPDDVWETIKKDLD